MTFKFIDNPSFEPCSLEDLAGSDTGEKVIYHFPSLLAALRGMAGQPCRGPFDYAGPEGAFSLTPVEGQPDAWIIKVLR